MKFEYALWLISDGLFTVETPTKHAPIEYVDYRDTQLMLMKKFVSSCTNHNCFSSKIIHKHYRSVFSTKIKSTLEITTNSRLANVDKIKKEKQ